jgi:hypothetical protein
MQQYTSSKKQDELVRVRQLYDPDSFAKRAVEKAVKYLSLTEKIVFDRLEFKNEHTLSDFFRQILTATR